MAEEVDTGELKASIIGSTIPGIGVITWFYLELLPLYRKLPAQISPEQADQFTALNSLILLSGLILFMTFKLINIGGTTGRYLHWKFFQEADEDAG